MTERIRVTTSLPSGGEVVAGWIVATATDGRMLPAVNFEYDADFLTEPEAFALSPDLPLVRGLIHARFDQSLFGAFADSGPDQWGRRLIEADRRRRARQAGERVVPLDELGLLLATNDATRQGALRFPDRQNAIAVHALDELDLADLVDAVSVFEETGDEERLRDIVPIGTTQGGARPKVGVLDSTGRLSIAKLPRPSDRWDVEAWEAATNRMAAAAGLTVPRVELHRVSEFRSVLVTRRFDREDGSVRRSYISARSFLQARDGDAGMIDYTLLASEVTSQSDTPSADGAELFRRVAFTLLVNNVDDHLRNHGLLRTRSGWTPAPAFDINPHPFDGALDSLPISPNDDPRERSILELAANADAFRVSSRDVRRILRTILDVVDGWAEYATAAGIPADGLSAMSGAFDGRARSEVARFVGI